MPSFVSKFRKCHENYELAHSQAKSTMFLLTVSNSEVIKQNKKKRLQRDTAFEAFLQSQNRAVWYCGGVLTTTQHKIAKQTTIMPPAKFEPRLHPTPRGNQDRPSLWVGVGSLAGTAHSAALSPGGFSIRRVRETVYSSKVYILQTRYFQLFVPQWTWC